MEPRNHRKTRVVCVSDTHAYTPSEAGFRLPAGDVLIHAGDLTNQGSLAELRRTIAWIAKTPYEVKIIIAGNHDTGLDPTTTTTETTQQCMEAVRNSNDPSIVYLCHEFARIRLTRADGPQTEFKVFGSPYTPLTNSSSSSSSKWNAFGYSMASMDSVNRNTGDPSDPSEEEEGLWNQIPLDTDILVTHTPPYAHRDRHDGHSQAPGATNTNSSTSTSSSGDPRTRPVGCPALRQALQRVRPRIAVCGHVHESRGCERLLWPPLSPLPLYLVTGQGTGQMTSESSDSRESKTEEQEHCQVVAVELPPIGSKKQSLVNLCPPQHHNHHHHHNATATQQRQRQRQQQSQQETCLVNAAILATSWPHPGGKRFHTPVVVDVDFPTVTPCSPTATTATTVLSPAAAQAPMKGPEPIIPSH